MAAEWSDGMKPVCVCSDVGVKEIAKQLVAEADRDGRHHGGLLPVDVNYFFCSSLSSFSRTGSLE